MLLILQGTNGYIWATVLLQIYSKEIMQNVSRDASLFDSLKLTDSWFKIRSLYNIKVKWCHIWLIAAFVTVTICMVSLFLAINAPFFEAFLCWNMIFTKRRKSCTILSIVCHRFEWYQIGGHFCNTTYGTGITLHFNITVLNSFCCMSVQQFHYTCEHFTVFIPEPIF